jgi:tRNA(adenine34) deaminase
VNRRSTARVIYELSTRLTVLFREPADQLDEQMGLTVCQEALAAATKGNYGVGAVLLDPEGQIVAKGQNQVFTPRFRSDLHAEMVTMNAFELQHPDIGNLWGYTLMCSLEPCPMCLARLLIAGVGTVKFLAEDDNGGMVRRIAQMSVAWTRLAQRQTFQQAAVSEGLRQFATDVGEATLDGCRSKLLARCVAPPAP